MEDTTEDDIKRQLAALQEKVVEMRATKMAEDALGKAQSVVANATNAMKEAQTKTASSTAKVKAAEEALEAAVDGHETAMLTQLCKMDETMTGMQDAIAQCVQQQRASTAQQQKDAAEMAALLEMVQGVADGAQKSIEAAQGIMRNATADLEKLREVSARILRMKPGQGNGVAAAGAGAGAVGGAGRGAGGAPGLLSLHGVVSRQASDRTGAMHCQLCVRASLCVCAN